MPLNRQKLARALEPYFKSPAKTALPGGNRLAAAYYEYALDAMSCGGAINPAGLPAKRSALSSQLAAAFGGGPPMPRVAKALGVFWSSPPVAFIGPTPGAVTAAPTASLSSALSALNKATVSRIAKGAEISAAEQASQLAKVLDTWTKTVLAAHAPPSACAGPLS